MSVRINGGSRGFVLSGTFSCQFAHNSRTRLRLEAVTLVRRSSPGMGTLPCSHSNAGSFEDEEDNVWNQMFELFARDARKPTLQDCLQEEDVCKVTLLCIGLFVLSM